MKTIQPPDESNLRRRETDVPFLKRTVTVGWALLAFGVLTACFAIIAVGLQRNSAADCEEGNDRRADAKVVATADVDADQAIWESIDGLLDNGIPEPARATIFGNLDTRRLLIESTYAPIDCG